jgi:carbon storage regulator
MSLVLSRRVNEAIVIGGNVTVTVVAIHGAQVRLAVDAPRDVTIWRDEILERMSKEDPNVNRTRIDD